MTINKISSAAIFSLTIFLSCTGSKPTPSVLSASAWDQAAEIEKSIVPPKFSDATFNILDFGATPEMGHNNTSAIAQAIEQCHNAGGGQVLIPEGVFYSGPIHLLDNVNLHLSEGAEIRFSTNSSDYLPLVHTSFEGTELMNYSPLIYAKGKKNIAITGKGVLNGQASNIHWWPWCGKEDFGWKKGEKHQNIPSSRPTLEEMAANGIPVEERIFGEGYNLRPTFIQFFECNNILIQGVKIINAPFWLMHPIKSQNITVDGVIAESHGPNNDGCNPEYSKNVMIKNCVFNTGDDCIAIKAGRDADGRRVGIPSERIIVKNCKMLDGHGGVVIGSETSAGIRDVFVEDCIMNSPNLDRAIRIKTNSKRGGTIENINVRNLKIVQVKEAVLKVNMFYATYTDQTGDYIPVIKNITLENIDVQNGGYYGILAKGYIESPIENITIKNVTIKKVDQALSAENTKNLRFIDTYINGSLMQSPPAYD